MSKKENPPLASRSLFDVSQYLELMKARETTLKDIVDRHFFMNTGMSDELFHSNLENLIDIRNKIVILKNEILISRMSNSIKFEDEEMSIEQALMLSNNIDEEMIIYKDLMSQFKSTDALYAAGHISYSDLSNNISALQKRKYKLNKMIHNESVKVKIDLDLEQFMF